MVFLNKNADVFGPKRMELIER